MKESQSSHVFASQTKHLQPNRIVLISIRQVVDHTMHLYHANWIVFPLVMCLEHQYKIKYVTSMLILHSELLVTNCIVVILDVILFLIHRCLISTQPDFQHLKTLKLYSKNLL